MEMAKYRRENAELHLQRMASQNAPPGSQCTPGGSQSVGKRIRGKSSYTPTTTPSTKTPDAKAIKMVGTPGEVKKSLFEEGDGSAWVQIKV